MGEKAPFEDKTVTHGMCDKCAERLEQQEKIDKMERASRTKES